MKTDTITVMIVDDDLASQQVLRHHLNTISGVVIIAVASGADEAYRCILEKVPDVIFLDVEMPGKSGFDLVSDLYKLNIHPCIIFQTAFDKYAIEAIKAAAFDYLLKPIERKELQESLVKFKNTPNTQNLEIQIENLLNQLKSFEKIRFNSRAGFVMIDPRDILFCQADWNYTELWFSKEKKEVVSMNIGKVAKMLPDAMFAKISRSVLINREYLTGFQRKTRLVVLQKGDFEREFKVALNQIKEIHV